MSLVPVLRLIHSRLLLEAFEVDYFLADTGFDHTLSAGAIRTLRVACAPSGITGSLDQCGSTRRLEEWELLSSLGFQSPFGVETDKDTPRFGSPESEIVVIP